MTKSYNLHNEKETEKKSPKWEIRKEERAKEKETSREIYQKKN
jgi:hypothetical protein